MNRHVVAKVGQASCLSSPLDSLLNEASTCSWPQMRRKAGALARKILDQKTLSRKEFVEALKILVFFGLRSRRSHPLVERAYRRLKIHARQRVRYWMLSFYGLRGNSSKVLRYATERPSCVDDLVQSLLAFAESGQRNKAHRLAQRGLRLLSRGHDAFDQSWGSHMVADYFTKNRQWDMALEACQKMPNHPFAILFDKFETIVKLHAVQTLLAIQNGLRALPAIAKIAVPDLGVKGLVADTKKHLKKFEKALEKILPRKARRDFGLGEHTRPACPGGRLARQISPGKSAGRRF